MGFTVEDMLLFSKDKFDMKLVAGANGWANSISWLLMVEDTTITQNFKGKELAVTTGLGFDNEKALLELTRILDEHHAAGLIINTGFYINEIPQSVLDYANSCDLPLMTVPWSVAMSEMIKDLTVRIFLQSQTDEQISACFIKSIEYPELMGEYRDDLSSAFDVDGQFQVILFTTDNLDSMDSMDRKRIGYRLQIYLENISHNAHFFYYDGCFILILNAVDESSQHMIIDGFLERAKRRMPEKNIYVGEGSVVNDASNIYISYRRAKYSVSTALKEQKNIVKFDELGINRILYSISDKLILKTMREEVLAPIIQYDLKHSSDFERTLMLYIKYDGSVQKVSNEMFIHKNTILYRMGKIKELLGSNLDDEDEKVILYLACKLRE